MQSLIRGDSEFGFTSGRDSVIGELNVGGFPPGQSKVAMTRLRLVAVFVRKVPQVFAAEFRAAGATAFIAIVAEELMADLEGSVVTAN